MKQYDNKPDVKPMSIMSLILSFFSLFVISGLLFFDQTPQMYSLLIGIDTLLCSLFLIQLTIDLIRSKNRYAFLKEHWIDVVASIPVIEPLRYGRIFQILRVIRIARSGRYIFKQINQNRKEATVASILLLLAFLITLGSTAILFVEVNQPKANITTAGDALWWAIVTVSTVGYGDYYPTTTLGRVVASIVLICGVGIFGMISGLITSLLATPNNHSSQSEISENNELLKQLIIEQKKMSKMIENIENNRK